MRLSFRTIFYTIVALTVLTLGVVGATGYFRGFDVPNTLLNSRLAQLIASRYGFRYQLDNLRFGCLRQSCSGDISFGAFDLIIATPEIFRIQLNSAEWTRRTPITARNLEIRSGTRPPLISLDNIQIDPRSSRTTVNGVRIQLIADDPASEIGRVEFDRTTQRVMAAGIQLRMKDRPPVGLEQAAVQGWQRSAADGWVVLDDVTARGLKLTIDQTRNSLNLCGPLPASDTLQRAMEPFRPILPLVRESFSKLRTDLLRLAIVAGILFFVFKLLSVLWVERWVVRLAVSTIPAAAPFVIYFVWRNALSTKTLVLAEGMEAVLAVVLFFIFVYRWRTKWYQLWEPLVLDFAAVFIMLPLLASGYELPSLPAAPAGIQVGRLDVANIDGQSNNGIQFQIPQTSIRNARLALPASDKGVLRVDVSSGEVAKARISVPPSSSIPVDNLRIDGITGEYDPKLREVRSISARIRLNGSIESDVVQRQLRNVEFLRGFNSGPNRLTFDLDLRASGGDVQPVVSDQFQAGEQLVAVNAAVALQLRDCTARYAVATRIRSKPLILSAQIDGDTRRVNIRTIRTLRGSPIQIGGGNGTITLNTGTPDINLGLKKIGGTFGSTNVSVETLSFSTSSRGIGGLAPQTTQISLGATTIHASREWEVQVAKAGMTVARRPNQWSVPVAVQSRFDDVRIKRPGEGSIEADWPVLETSISGQTTPELIPHHFSGTIGFQGSEANATRDAVGTDRHLLINADIWKGLLNIPQQDLVLRGPIISGRSVEVPLRLELAGRLISVYPRLTATLETEAAVSHFEQTLGSSTLAFSDARFTGRLDVNDTGASGSLKYGTGWNSVELQSEPIAFCLDEISRLDVAATGHIAKLSPALPLLSLDPSTATSCSSIPSLPNKVRFRISGVFPPGPQTYAIQVERENGDGIRVRDIEANIQTLQIQGGRLKDMHTGVKLTGIQNLQGGGGLDVRSDVEQVGDGLQIRSTLLDSEGTPLLDAALSGTENRFTLDAKQHVPADQLIRRFQSFIPSLASALNGIDPKGRITTVHAEANFDRGTFVEASAVGQFASGAILSTDSPRGRLDISTKDENAGAAFHLDIGRPSETDGVHPVVAGIDLRDASVRLVTDRNGESQTSLSLGLETRGSLFRRVTPPPRPVVKTVVQVGSGLSRQVSNIADLVRDQNTSESLSNFDWNLRLTQTSPAKPVVRMETDAVQLGIDVASFGASWDSTGQDRSRVAGSVRLDATVSESDNQLILDSLAPIAFSYSRGGEPETRIESILPVQVAFAERLSEAKDKTRTLWNEDFYSQFWRDHPSRFSPTALVSPIDRPEVTFGPVFFRQIQFPDRPLQVSIGYSRGLQVRLPISGRALFGNVEGRLEATLTPSPAATLDTRLTLDVKGIQADALQTIRAGSHSAILEDELDGNFSLTLDGLTMDREALSAARAGQFNSDELRKIGLSVHMLRTRDGARWPGVFQSSSNLEINLLNEVLNRIAKDLRLSAPPRALTYRNLNLDVDVDHGRVQTDRDILRLGGLQLFSSDFIDVTGEIRAHAGSAGERVMLSDLIEMLRGFSSTEPDRP